MDLPDVTNHSTADRALTWASGALNEALMGFLALVALAIATGPLVFPVPAAVESWLAVAEWVILALFIAEFFVQLAVTPDRPAWLRSQVAFGIAMGMAASLYIFAIKGWLR